ncbi:MAG: hypothetical protein LBT14_12695 [Treponema sp.]|nr:hypothetical protein [Treponema sp.]
MHPVPSLKQSYSPSSGSRPSAKHFAQYLSYLSIGAQRPDFGTIGRQELSIGKNDTHLLVAAAVSGPNFPGGAWIVPYWMLK